MDGYVLVIRGFPDKRSADEMAGYLWSKIDHYRWATISLESVDGKEVELLHGWDNP